MPEINLYDLLAHYAKYWLFLAVSIVLGFTAGLAYTNYIQVPQYKSNATLILINSDQTSSVKDATTINNYIELVKSRRVLQPVINDRKLGQSYEQLADSIGTSNDKDTEVVKLSVSTSDPNVSQNVLNDAIASFKKQLKSLYDNDNVQVVDSASLPTEPYNVRSTLQIGLATIAGLLLAVIVVFFIYDFNLSRQNAPQPQVAPVKKKSKKRKKQPSKLRKKFSAQWKSLVKDFKVFFNIGQAPKAPAKTTVKKD